MTPAEELLERIDAAILVDEVGIETGPCEDGILKTFYQPVFRRTPAGLVPWGVAGAGRVQRDRQVVPLRSFLAGIAGHDRPFFEGLDRMLQLRNHRNIGVDGLVLLYNHDPRLLGDVWTPEGQADRLMRLLAEAEIDPALVTLFLCEEPATEEGGALAGFAEALHSRNIRIAVTDFGTGPASAARIRRIDPQIVKLRGDWFRRIVGVPEAVHLFGSLVEALRREGREVLIEGIEKRAHLRTALDSGADLLQGSFLRPPRPVGVLFDTAGLDIQALLSGDGKVIPLFTTRQSRPA